MLWFLLGGFYFLAIPRPDKHTIQWPRGSAISLFLTQLAIQLTNTNVGITAMVVPYPAQFFLCVGVWVRVWGLWDFGINDSFVSSYSLFQRIRDALEIWYRRSTKSISLVWRYNFTELIFVFSSCGKYRLFFCLTSVTITMAIEFLSLDLGCGNFILTNSIAFFYSFGLTSIVTLH